MSRVWHPQFVAVVTIVDMNGHHGEYDCCCVETAVHYHHYQVDCFSQYYEAPHLEVSMANETFAWWTKYLVFYSFHSVDRLCLRQHCHRASRRHENYCCYLTTQLERQEMISIAGEIVWNVSSISSASAASWILILLIHVMAAAVAAA